MPNTHLKRPLSFTCGSDLTRLSSTEEGGEKLLLVLKTHIVMTTPSLPGRLHCLTPKAMVGGDHLVDCPLRPPTLLRDFLRFPGSHQSMIDNKPALTTPGARSMLEPVFDCFNGQMGCGTGDSCHVFFLLT